MKEHWPPIYPGHPDYLLPAEDGEVYCQGNFVFNGSNKLCHYSNGYLCTRANNHTGDHAAHSENEMFLSWSDKEGIHNDREDRVNEIAHGHYNCD